MLIKGRFGFYSFILKALRLMAASFISLKNATVSNSSFHEPHTVPLTLNYCKMPGVLDRACAVTAGFSRLLILISGKMS